MIKTQDEWNPTVCNIDTKSTYKFTALQDQLTCATRVARKNQLNLCIPFGIFFPKTLLNSWSIEEINTSTFFTINEYTILMGRFPMKISTK